jgi:hypothetical protein
MDLSNVLKKEIKIFKSSLAAYNMLFPSDL